MPKILIIDDESEIRVMLRQLLEREGFEVLDASNGNDGLRLLHENPVELVITDIVMPDKEGLETIQDLKKLFPDIKIIAISGGSRIQPGEYLRLAQRFGAAKTFTKPVRKKDLLEAINSLI